MNATWELLDNDKELREEIISRIRRKEEERIKLLMEENNFLRRAMMGAEMELRKTVIINRERASMRRG